MTVCRKMSHIFYNIVVHNSFQYLRKDTYVTVIWVCNWKQRFCLQIYIQGLHNEFASLGVWSCEINLYERDEKPLEVMVWHNT